MLNQVYEFKPNHQGKIQKRVLLAVVHHQRGICERLKETDGSILSRLYLAQSKHKKKLVPQVGTIIEPHPVVIRYLECSVLEVLRFYLIFWNRKYQQQLIH